MGKNHGNNNKEVQETNKEVIEAKVVTPEETEAEDAAKETEDNNADVTPPKDNKDDKEPKKEPSLIRKATDKVKGGVKKVLSKQFTIGQVLGLVAGVGAAVFIGKTIYERGQQDALETVGGDADDDENLLEVHDDEVSYSDSEGGDEEVYDEESEAEEAAVSEDGENEEAAVSEDGENEEVYDEEDEVYDEDMTE
jgi:hypothetical protein